MKTLTWSDFDQHKPCYSPAERYGEWSGTVLDLLKREDIPAIDRIWAATREGILDDKTLRLFACKCVREVWHLLTDESSRNAVEVAERYAMGEATYEELTAARDAAMSATRDAAWDAAWAVAEDAAGDAAWDAARAAEGAATRERRRVAAHAAWAAAWGRRRVAADAAWAAARAAACVESADAWGRRRVAADAAWVESADAREKQVQILIQLTEEVQP